jgi:hypothetical protein
MGVDYYTCANCDFGYRDDSEYACFCECGNNYCRKDCGKLENYQDYSEETDDNEENCRIDKSLPITCVICRKEKSTDYAILEALLKHFKITRKQAEKIWKNGK